ncbi:MAG: TIM barrel protein [Candidatus Gracilibacteria bacterium]|jgi:sugar phosphate isomerase/epimerase|nr:TIM barrel protein [Candidatus Gracilibacteria bacterium]
MLILSTDSLKGYGLHRIFEIAKNANYDGIDLAVHFDLFDTFNEEYLKKLMSDFGLTIHTVSAPPDISSEQIIKLVKLTKELNAKILILQPPKYLDSKLTKWMKKEIPALREKEKISIALENSPAGTFLLGILPAHAMSNSEDLKKFKHIALDTSRLGEKKQDLIRSYAAFRKFLVTVHLSNIQHGKKYAPPQNGILPLESFLSKLKQDDFPGAISLKVLPKTLGAGSDERVFEGLKKAKDFVDKFYTKLEVEKEKEEELPPEEIEE